MSWMALISQVRNQGSTVMLNTSTSDLCDVTLLLLCFVEAMRLVYENTIQFSKDGSVKVVIPSLCVCL